MKQKKNTFFKNVWDSITNFDKYKDFALEPVVRTVKYIVLLTLITTLIFSGALVVKLSTRVPELTNYIQTNVPNLEFGDNILSVEQTEVIELIQEDNYIVIIDTTQEGQAKLAEYEEKIKLYNNGVILLQNKAILKNSATTILNAISYQDLIEGIDIQEFNKQDIINYLQSNKMINIMMSIYVATLIYLFSVYITTFVLDALLLGIMCKLLAMLSRLKVQFRSAFGLATHALTLPIVLNLIYMVSSTFADYTIKYFNWMYKIIAYIYIITAIFIIRSELLKQQMQLTKIISEQEKVKIEIEERKRKEKEEQEKEEVQKKDREKAKNDKGKIKEEPEGSKA